MHGRPDSVKRILEITVDYLDLLDRATQMISEATGKEAPPRHRVVQGDLQMIAAWMKDHPEIDAQIMEVLNIDEYM